MMRDHVTTPSLARRDLLIEAVMAGQPVKTPVTRAYGCTVKYA